MDLRSQENTSQLEAGLGPFSSAAIDRPTRVGAPLYADIWPNRKVAKVAAMAVAGYTANSIASSMADGTTANDVTAMLSDWGLKRRGTRHSYASVPVELAGMHRTRLADEAQRRGMEMPELIARMTEAIVRDELFDAVLD